MNHQQYLERHYDRLFARYAVNDVLAKRMKFADLPVPAIAIYQSSFGRDLLMPGVRMLSEARDGLRCLAMRWLLLADRKKEVVTEVAEHYQTEQMELFA